MSREIIFYENHFIEFYQSQDEKVKEKMKYVLELIKQVEKVPEKFLKHLTGTNGLYEIRIENWLCFLMVFRKNPKRHQKMNWKKH